MVDVMKVENLLIGIAMSRFSNGNRIGRDEFWNLLMKYSSDLDLLNEEVRPNADVYNRLIREQFDYCYTYFCDENDWVDMGMNVDLVRQKCATNKELKDYMQSMLTLKSLPEELK